MAQRSKNYPFVAYQYRGVRYDGGSQLGFLLATIARGLEHEAYCEQLREHSKDQFAV